MTEKWKNSLSSSETCKAPFMLCGLERERERERERIGRGRNIGVRGCRKRGKKLDLETLRSELER